VAILGEKPDRAGAEGHERERKGGGRNEDPKRCHC
jgi:hypothetical protein